jgi:hypothetical protein
VAYRFSADLHGLPAVATVEFEQLYSYTVMAGEISSAQASYSFSADIYGDGGYGDMVDRVAGGSFRIQIQNLSEAGFVLIANPFQGPTSYIFRSSA